jgi:transcriptional regulator with XRE-family HTH domain
MNLEQFGEELKQARMSKELSLMDISAETRISIKFLESMERGEFHLLPQTYVRAFLREYALMVGFDPREMMERYKSAQQESPSRKPENTTVEQNSLQDPASEQKDTPKQFSLSPLQRNIAFGVMITAAVVLVAVLATINKTAGPRGSVEEVPFDRVIRENEAASIPPPVPAADSTPFNASVHSDSLRLEITTRDSVWINILIDGKIGQTYLFGAKKKRIWAAKERFVITMGNAGGATFLLNGKDIGTLGKRGAVVRNAVITEANLKN